MRVCNTAFKDVMRRLIAEIDEGIRVDETMAEAAALVARDFLDGDQPRIAAYLREIARQHQISALHLGGQREALKVQYGFLS